VRRALAVLVTATAFAAAGAPAAMAGSGNPSGTGPPNQTCQDIESSNVLPSTGAGNSPGSVFNEPINGSAGGTGGAAYNNAGAPSQYDVACYQTSLHHH
jgi:hypothetical protein